MKLSSKVVAFAASSAFAGMAQAAVDTTAVTGALTDAGAAGVVVASAVIVVIVGIKAFKFIRSAL